jgi:hypothetical protein
LVCSALFFDTVHQPRPLSGIPSIALETLVELRTGILEAAASRKIPRRNARRHLTGSTRVATGVIVIVRDPHLAAHSRYIQTQSGRRIGGLPARAFGWTLRSRPRLRGFALGSQSVQIALVDWRLLLPDLV